MISHNRNRVLPLALTAAFCAMAFSLLAQKGEDTITVAPHHYIYVDTDLQFDPIVAAEVIDGDTVFRFAQILPKFPGGADSLTAYLRREIIYPNYLEVAGTVLVEFVVEKDGSVTQPRVKVSLYPEFHDKEALRVIQSMPKWEPATVNGAPVRCYYQVPVTWRM